MNVALIPFWGLPLPSLDSSWQLSVNHVRLQPRGESMSRGHVCSLPPVFIFSRMIIFFKKLDTGVFHGEEECLGENLLSVPAVKHPLLHLRLPQHTQTAGVLVPAPLPLLFHEQLHILPINSLFVLTRVSFCYLKPGSCRIGPIFLSLIKPTQDITKTWSLKMVYDCSSSRKS